MAGRKLRRLKSVTASILTMCMLGSFIAIPQSVLAEGTIPPVVAVADKARTEIDFNENWKFMKGSNSEASSETFNDSSWRQLNLPHDWSIEEEFTMDVSSEIGHLPGGTAWYRKSFDTEANWENKEVEIFFGGVYMDSSIYINGRLVGHYPSGYQPFSYNITKYLKPVGQTNTIAVQVINVTDRGRQSSRWYSGAGIYRSVNLTVTDTLRVKRYGVKINTPNLESEMASNSPATVNVDTVLVNSSANPRTVVLKQVAQDFETSEAAGAPVMKTVTVPGNAEINVSQVLQVANPVLWTTETDKAQLYKVHTQVLENDQAIDDLDSRFGLRYFSFTHNDGFSLNGKYHKLFGVCMHHDQGALGAVANYDAIYRQMRIMKDMGVNSIRVTHNPASEELLLACDKLGLTVVEEAFDTWYQAKNPNDYGRFFEQAATHPEAKAGDFWSDYDLKVMVARAQNFPSIIMVSLGNEIYGTDASGSKAVNTARRLYNAVKSVKADRLVTMGENKLHNNNARNVSAVLDVVGQNYWPNITDSLYNDARFADKPIYGSETSSAVKSRGYYADPNQDRSSRTIVIGDHQLSSYDNSSVSWGHTATDSWIVDRDRHWYGGGYIWTGFDYIGEPTPWNQSFTATPKSSYFGIVDTAGFPKDDYYLYQSQWLDVNTNPMVHIMPHWNWENQTLFNRVKDNQNRVPVRIYSNAPKVELFKDGESLGKKAFYQFQASHRTYQRKDQNSKHLYLEWLVPWVFKPGTKIEAVAYNDNDEVIARDVVTTAGAPAAIKLTPEKYLITPDGYSLAYIEASIVDAEGNICPTAMNMMNFNLQGQGEIVGVDNGDANSWERYKDYSGSWRRSAFNGKAIIITRSTKEAGSFTLTATGAGLNPASTRIFSTDEHKNPDDVLFFEDYTGVTSRGTAPVLPNTVNAILGDGRLEQAQVVWNTVDQDLWNTPGTHEVTGTATYGTQQGEVKAIVRVREVRAIQPVPLSTGVGVAPALPTTVTLIYHDGEVENVPVTWETKDASAWNSAGIVEVNGTVDGQTLPALATVRVVQDLQKVLISANDFEDAPTLSASYIGGDEIESINDGKIAINQRGYKNRWSNWNKQAPGHVTMTWSKPYTISNLDIDFFKDSGTDRAQSFVVQYQDANGDWQAVNNQQEVRSKVVPNFGPGEDTTNLHSAVTFDPVSTNAIRLQMVNKPGVSIAITEVKVQGLAVNKLGLPSVTDLALDSQTVEGFDAATKSYEKTLPWTAAKAVPQLSYTLSETLDNVSVVLLQADSVTGKAILRLAAESGETQMYTVNFDEAQPVIDHIDLTVNGDMTTPKSVLVGDTLNFAVSIYREDGSLDTSNLVTVPFIEGDQIFDIKGSEIRVTSEGTSSLSIELQDSVTQRTIRSNTIQIQATRPAENAPYAVYIEPVVVKTFINEAPVLPETVLVDFSNGFKAVNTPVVWETLASTDIAKEGTYVLVGKLQDQDLNAQAKVIVRKLVSAENFAQKVIQKYEPDYPLTTDVTLSDGEVVKDLSITWNKPDAAEFAVPGNKVVTGTVSYMGQSINTSLNVEVVALAEANAAVETENYAREKTGFDLPLAIASFTNNSDPATNTNDAIVNFDPNASAKNWWTNWKNTPYNASDWVGAIMAISGNITPVTAEIVNVGFVSEPTTPSHFVVRTPESYKIEYYVGPEFPVPASSPVNSPASNLRGSSNPLADDNNWREVEYIDHPSAASSEMTQIRFQPVKSTAFRVSMRAQSGKCLGITEFEVFGRTLSPETSFEVRDIKANGKSILSKFDSKLMTSLPVAGTVPNFTVEVTKGASYTVKNLQGMTEIKVTSQDGKKSKVYMVKHVFSSREIVSYKPFELKRVNAKDTTQVPLSTSVEVTLNDGTTKVLPIKFPKQLLKPGYVTVYADFVDLAKHKLSVKPSFKVQQVLYNDSTAPVSVNLNGWTKMKDGNIRYYTNNVPAKGVTLIGKTTYLFDAQGNQKRGWHVIGGVAMYFNSENGGRWTGLRTIGKTTYLLDAKRGKLTGWHVINGVEMYFDMQNGGRRTGLVKTHTGVYYLLSSSKGKLKGWHLINGKAMYFSPVNGARLRVK